MCGIVGVMDHDEFRAAELVSRLNYLQVHRGPDHGVVARAGPFTLGNSRLAVQAPGAEGNQPFRSQDGRYVCVFNGEIYNYRQLVDRFGLAVRTRCDGEIIPHLWEKLGIAAFAELRGMFSIALVDCLEGLLYLARDRFGIKPLYWYLAPGKPFLFASELRPLAAVAGNFQLDRAAIVRYLALGSMAADQSPFTPVAALPPGWAAIIDSHARVRTQPFCTAATASVRDGSAGGAVARPGLAAALIDSIDLHLAADVPTALLLSGGVDSATIASVGRRLGRDLHCITVATEGSADESAQAMRTAAQYGHRFQRIRAALTDADAADFFAAMQRPSIDGLNTYLVCRAVHEAGFKVALSGLGGDEALGGYSHFRLLPYLRLLRGLDRVPPTGKAAGSVLARSGLIDEAKARVLLGRAGPRDGWGLSLLQREVLPSRLAADLAGVDSDILCDQLRPPGTGSDTSFGSLVDAEVAIYLQSTLLPDADTFSMASSVELRVPFVDGHVFAAGRASTRAHGAAPGKAALGRALDDPYLHLLADHPKRGFSVPMREWMAGPLAAVLAAADAPDARVWSEIDRSVAQRAGLLPLRARERWSVTWVIVALNAWLESIQAVASG